MEAKQTRRPRRTAVEIKNFLELYKQGDLTAKEFCKINDINQAAFYKWKSRYAEAAVKKSSFLVLQPQPAAAASEPKLFAEVKGIKLYQAVEACYLKQLLA